MAVRKPAAKPWSWETLGDKQALYKQAIQEKQVIFGVGPAGTGKTLIPTYVGLDMLFDKGMLIEKIYVSRPLITVGEKMGTLPGTIDEKIGPYLAPVWDIIAGSDHPNTQELLNPRNEEERKLVGRAVNMMRGSTVRDAYWILDEAQNLTRSEFEMALTRVGHNSKLIITGDPDQQDIKPGTSGLEHAIKLMQEDPAVAVIRFTVDDVKRSDFVGRVIRAYAADRSGK